MEVATAAVAIACGAFLITQIHLWRVARRLIRKSEDSWALARTTIFESSRAIHNDVVGEIQKLEQKSGPESLKTVIAELNSRVSSIPMMLDDRFLKIQGGLRESFVTFGDQLGKTLDDTIAKAIPNIGFKGGDPRAAQSLAVESRKVNQIVKTLEVGSATGGNVIGAVNQLAEMLQQFGQPGLAEWLEDNPDKLPMVISQIQRNPRLAQGLAKLEARMTGVPVPGNGSRMQGGIDIR